MWRRRTGCFWRRRTSGDTRAAFSLLIPTGLSPSIIRAESRGPDSRYRIGPYKVAALIGQGGMGDVYRATDTNLGRDVAIKVLPDTFSQDSERLARFEREAKMLASLNHPNIAIIHGVERADASAGSAQRPMRALVMEFVEGPTLADRIAHGPVPIDEALPIADRSPRRSTRRTSRESSIAT